MSIEQTRVTRMVLGNETRAQIVATTEELDRVLHDLGVPCRVYYAADGGIDEYRTFGRLID
ncbi:hypothetical protein [Rhodococcus sovatensis]|jgi:hypothetical protein|uniref:Uncharacterized protein n=1 Tax=Rhodococcus sovatensis TaxID=1805840 RepID=A0ABZ2PFE6_9NOCA